MQNSIFHIEENLLLNLQIQVKKDFYPFTEFFPEDFETITYPASEILEFTKLNLVSCIEKNQHSLMQLLYKVDLAENKFLKLIQKEHFLDELLQAIIKREIEKIYWKSKFK